MGDPNDAALLRLAGMLLLEQNDEWLVGRRYLSESSMAPLDYTTDQALGTVARVGHQVVSRRQSRSPR